MTFTTTVDQTTGAAGDVLGVCQPNGSVIHYRGADPHRQRPTGTNRTVNDVLVENYLRGVLSREVSTSWGDAGAGAGMHSLRAMAVAARSFALSQNRYAYAKTCDTSACQVYGGAAYRASPAAPTSHPTVRVCETGNLTFECANTNRAVVETAGVVRVWPGNGRVVSTEYSASHGPRSAGGQFPPVDDSASNVAQNTALPLDPHARRSRTGAAVPAGEPDRGIDRAGPVVAVRRRVGPTRRAAGDGPHGRRVGVGLPQRHGLPLTRLHDHRPRLEPLTGTGQTR